jgi:hypothetical protein
MAKKNRTAKRSTKAGKRRPATKRKSKRKAKPVAQNIFFPVGVASFDPTPYLTAAHQRRLSAAVQATIGGAETPLPLKAADLAAGAPIIGTPALSVMPGTSSLVADAIVIPAPIKAVIVDRLSKQPVDIRDAAGAFAHELNREAENLRSHRPNDRSQHELAKYDDLVSILEKIAAGLTNLAAALDEAIKEATERTIDPARLTSAAQITHGLQEAVMQWIENNAGSRITTTFNVALFTGSVVFLHYLGADTAAAIGALGWIVRGGGKRKDPPKKKGEPPKKKRR